MRPVTILATAMLVLAFALTCFGQEHAITTEDGTVLGGEGFSGAPPSYLVLVKVESRHSGAALGSGTFLTDRLVLTCYHNVRGVRKSDRVGIHTTDGTVYWKTRVVHTAPRFDLALILIDEPVKYHRTLTVCDTPYPVTVCAFMGFSPPHNALLLSQGVTNGKQYGNRWGDRKVYFEAGAEFNQGMSGGPVIDPNLQLVGVGVSSDGEDAQATMLYRIHQFLDSYKGEIGVIED